MSNRVRLDAASERMRGSRKVTQSFLGDLTAAEWYWSPKEFTTHVAWQVGHIAVGQYSLCLRRVRGRTAADEKFVSDAFLTAFGIGSAPAADPKAMPPLEEIQRTFDAVFEKCLAELATHSDAELDVPLEQPHPIFQTRLMAVEFASQHELVHAGQIAFLRRLMGKKPLR